MLSRYDRLKKYMAEDGIDVAVIISPANTIYFSETYIMTQKDIPDRLAITVLPLSGEPAIIACCIEQNTVDSETWIKDRRYYVEFQQSPIDFLADVLEERGLADARIGIELGYLTASYYQELMHRMPNINLVNCKRIFEKVRMIKEPKEIKYLADAANITRVAMEKGLQEVHPGCTEREFANKVKTYMINDGLSAIDFFVMGACEKSVLVHALPTDNVMRGGDQMRLDFGGVGEGHYLSDFARTVMVGELNQKYVDIYTKMCETQEEIFSHIRAGVPASELFRVCADGMTKRGLPFNIPHIGHSLGIECHEFPMLSPVEDFALEENMVFNFEPVVMTEGRMFHFEDLVLVKKDGFEILSNTQVNPGLLRIV